MSLVIKAERIFIVLIIVLTIRVKKNFIVPVLSQVVKAERFFIVAIIVLTIRAKKNFIVPSIDPSNKGRTNFYCANYCAYY